MSGRSAWQGVVLERGPVRLEPLAEAQLEALWACAQDADLWRHSPEPVHTREDLAEYLRQALLAAAVGAAMPYAIVHQDRIVGSTRLARIDRHHGVAEIGWTWIARDWQRSIVNTSCKRLLLGHAFDVLELARVELRCHAENHRSRAAIERLGARHEGILRSHMHMPAGPRRDTCVYAILREEWPQVRARLDGFLL